MLLFVETIRCYPLLCRVIADTVELGFSAQFAEQILIILVHLDVRVVCCEREAMAMHHDSLQYIRMAAL